MGFLDALNGAVGRSRRGGASEQVRLAESWGLGETSHSEFPGPAPAAEPVEMTAPPETLDYDRAQWRKKVKRILEKLPASQAEWEPMLTEARALGFDEAWVLQTELEEFRLMVRRAVADCNVTADEHRRLDLARSLIGLSEEDAEELLHAVVAEAEAFFGHSVEGA
jgi:hypothetical protein